MTMAICIWLTSQERSSHRRTLGNAPVTVLMAAQRFGTDPESRAGFYVGATRAQVRLYVTASEDAPLIGEMREVRRRLPSLNSYIR